MYPAYVLVLVLGLRLSEVLGQVWAAAVDFEDGELSIGLQLQLVSRELLHRATKTAASEDTLPMVGFSAAVLGQRKDQQEADRRRAGDEWQHSGLIFTTKPGTLIEPRNFKRSWTNRRKRAGVRRITVHGGRRTCGTLLVANHAAVPGPDGRAPPHGVSSPAAGGLPSQRVASPAANTRVPRPLHQQPQRRRVRPARPGKARERRAQVG
nr:tyrosine-type recombinase/integrase [Allokutzneria albata]